MKLFELLECMGGNQNIKITVASRDEMPEVYAGSISECPFLSKEKRHCTITRGEVIYLGTKNNIMEIDIIERKGA